MSAAERLLGKKIRWVTDYEPALSGKIMEVSKVCADTSEGSDIQGLPWFKVKDDNGNEYSAFENELRTADGSQRDYGDWPPIPDMDPDVVAVSNEFHEKYKDFFDNLNS